MPEEYIQNRSPAKVPFEQVELIEVMSITHGREYLKIAQLGKNDVVRGDSVN